jgi:hypothetical protein
VWWSEFGEIDNNRVKNPRSREHKNVVMILVEILYYLGLLACFVPLTLRFSAPGTSEDILGFHSDFWSFYNDSINSSSNFWSWCHTGMIPKIYDGVVAVPELVTVQGSAISASDSNPFATSSSPRVVGGSGMVLMGPVRLRQLRVNQGNCSDDFAYRSIARYCSERFHFQQTDSKVSYWQSQTPAYLAGAFSYRAESDVAGVIQSTESKINYPSGGFILDLPPDKFQAIQSLQDLEAASWIDPFTAAIVVEMTVYYPSLKFFAVDQLLFEFSESGFIQTSQHVETFPSFSISFASASSSDMLLNVFSIVFQVAGIISIVITLWNIRKRFFLLVWNWFDLVMLSIAFVYMALRISLLKLNPSDSFGDPTEFMSLVTLIPTKRVAIQLQTTLLALIFIRSFKFTLIFPLKIARAMRSSFLSFTGLVIVCALVQLGMSFGLHLAVGYRYDVYAFISDALSAVTLSSLNVIWATGVTGIGAFLNLWFIWAIYFVTVPMMIAVAIDAWTSTEKKSEKRHPFLLVFEVWTDRIRRRPIVEHIEPAEVDLDMFPSLVRKRIHERRKETRLRVENEFGYFPAEYSEYHDKIDMVELQRALDGDSLVAKILGSASAVAVAEQLKQANSIDSFQTAVDRKLHAMQREQLNLTLKVDPRIDPISAEIQETIVKMSRSTANEIATMLSLVKTFARSVDDAAEARRMKHQKLK